MILRKFGQRPGAARIRLMSERQATRSRLLRAILTDSHFWVPALVLACGIALLAAIQAG